MMGKLIESGAPAAAGGNIPCQDPMTFGTLVLWPITVLSNMLLWLERSRQRHHLHRLSNHMLKDIGLSRVDVDFEFRKLPWRE